MFIAKRHELLISHGLGGESGGQVFVTDRERHETSLAKKMNGRVALAVLVGEDCCDMARYGEDSAECYLALTSAPQVESDASADAFVLLVNRQSRFVFRVAFSVVRNVQDAEDVVQETFLKVYRAGGWGEIREERAFLARVAWRLAVNRARRDLLCTPTAEAADATANAEAALIKGELEAALHRLMDALPLELRLPLALSSVDEMTSPEVASVMGIPEGTVRSRLARARAILRQKLTELEVRRG